MFRYNFFNNISIYDVSIKLDCDKISIFIPLQIDIIAYMMYACNGIKYHTFDMAVFGCPVRHALRARKYKVVELWQQQRLES